MKLKQKQVIRIGVCVILLVAFLAIGFYIHTVSKTDDNTNQAPIGTRQTKDSQMVSTINPAPNLSALAFSNNKPSEKVEEKAESEETKTEKPATAPDQLSKGLGYTNSDYTSFTFTYDPSWILENSKTQSRTYGDLQNQIISLKKNSTTLFISLEPVSRFPCLSENHESPIRRVYNNALPTPTSVTGSDLQRYGYENGYYYLLPANGEDKCHLPFTTSRFTNNTYSDNFGGAQSVEYSVNMYTQGKENISEIDTIVASMRFE